jgi:hypothetical protein
MAVAAVHLTYVDEDLRPKCPACSSYRVKAIHSRLGAWSPGDQLHNCLACDALFGTFARFDDSYQYVDDKWCGCQIPKGAPDVKQRYFDFTGLRTLVAQRLQPSLEQRRRHGWYHPACGRLTQVG